MFGFNQFKGEYKFKGDCMSEQLTVYGIKNCNTMKKCFDYLTSAGVVYTFFDYKKSVPTMAEFETWVQAFGLAKVINKQGLTYKKLGDDTKALLAKASDDNDVALAYSVVSQSLSMIKRPIVMGDYQGKAVALIGFDEGEFDGIFR